MKGRRVAALGLACVALGSLAWGGVRLAGRFTPGCEAACVGLSAHQGAFLTVGGLFLGSLAVLAWDPGREGDATPPSSP